MKLKLAASFLLVSVLCSAIALLSPRLSPDPLWSAVLVVSADLAVGLGAAWLVAGLLTRRLRALAAATAVIRAGDLTRQVRVAGSDEVAELARSFGVMVESLHKVVVEVRRTAERINASATALSGTCEEMNVATDGIAAAAHAIADGAEAQADRVADTAATTRHLAASIERVSQGAREVHSASREAARRASGGVAEARRSNEAILSLAERIGAAAASIEGFRSRADEIVKISTFIASLSQQTHVLAINAAIEAARAGEDGRGFAVVADEVRRLADDVCNLAERVSVLSEEIHGGAIGVADGIRDSVGSAEDLRSAIVRTAESFEGIVETIRRTEERAGEISELTMGQRRAADALRSSLDEISTIAGRNAAGTEETSAATRRQTSSMHAMAASATALARTSDELRHLISIFKVE